MLRNRFKIYKDLYALFPINNGQISEEEIKKHEEMCSRLSSLRISGIFKTTRYSATAFPGKGYFNYYFVINYRKIIVVIRSNKTLSDDGMMSAKIAGKYSNSIITESFSGNVNDFIKTIKTKYYE